MGKRRGLALVRTNAQSNLLPYLLAALGKILDEERDRWFLWVPVCFGIGIAIYFALPEEPSSVTASVLVTASIVACYLLRTSLVPWLLSIATVCIALGFADAKLRTHIVSQYLLEREGTFTLTGIVMGSESRPHGYRMTLNVTSPPARGGAHFPNRVRLTSRFEGRPSTGAHVKLRARLKPLPEPVTPGGFDFSRKAYFDGLGATGFILGKPEILENRVSRSWFDRAVAALDATRRMIETRIEASLPEDMAALATALITGDRGRIPEETLRSIRDSGLAHMLAISGMHMAIMAGSLYWLLRAAGAAIPGLVLHYPVKKWAALLALFGAGGYLLISGGAVATQRAFLMMGIMFTAIMLDRPALTLRNVALAAIVILALFPESLLDISFQMSFAAVTALIAVYERVEARKRHTGTPGGIFHRLSRYAWLYIGGIALTTLVASIAISPFAAYTFHKLSQYSLLANLAAMPFFGLVVMPGALLSLIGMPLGLEHYPLAFMGWGIGMITSIAMEISGWDGAVLRIAAMPVISFLALVMGGLWLCLWRTRWRLGGILMACLGLLTAGTLKKPDLLIERDAKLVAGRVEGGKFSTTAGVRKNYSLEKWLARDGDDRAAETVLKERGFNCDELACIATIQGKNVAVIRHPAAIADDCEWADIIIATIPLRKKCRKARITLDKFDLWARGAHALYLDGQSIRVETVANERGNRPWTGPTIPRQKQRSGGTAFAGDAPKTTDGFQ